MLKRRSDTVCDTWTLSVSSKQTPILVCAFCYPSRRWIQVLEVSDLGVYSHGNRIVANQYLAPASNSNLSVRLAVAEAVLARPAKFTQQTR